VSTDIVASREGECISLCTNYGAVLTTRKLIELTWHCWRRDEERNEMFGTLEHGYIVS